MTTVIEMLGHQAFAGFRLATDKSGLYNQVSNSGIFEWEQGEDIPKSFGPGDFILTTLAPYSNKVAQAEFYLRRLIECKPSAIAIKEVFFSEITDETIEYANKNHVPIFFFNTTFIDDIVFTIKNTLTPGEINFSAVQKMRKILYDNISSFEKDLIAKEINQYFYDNILCMLFLPRNQENASEILFEYEKKYLATTVTPDRSAKNFYSLLRFPRGICLLYSSPHKDADLVGSALETAKELGIDSKTFSYGISEVSPRLSNLDITFKEGLYASIEALMENKPVMHFNDIGMTQILCPLRKDYWVHRYVKERMDIIQAYDNKKNSEIWTTVVAFVKCKCSYDATSKLLFSHTNTVRYRIRKAYELLGITDAIDANGQLATLVKLNEINKILSGLLI